jgi:hypothetical protein
MASFNELDAEVLSIEFRTRLFCIFGRIIDVSFRRFPQINGQGGQVCRVPFNRWLMMPAAVIIQMCVGTFYGTYSCSFVGFCRFAAESDHHL